MSVVEILPNAEPDSPQYYLYKEYARAIKSMLSKIIYLKRFDREKQPKIIYSTPRRAWATHVVPLVNGGAETPIISFYLNGVEPVETTGGFVSWKEEDPNDENKILRTYSPIVTRLTFTTTIWANTMDDMDTMLSQIMIYCSNPKLWASKVDGAWCEIEASNYTIEDEMDPGDAKDKVLRRGVTLTVRRAYIPRESWTVNKINDINVTIELAVNET